MGSAVIVHILAQARMHANTDTETVIDMRFRVIHDDETCFTSTSVIFKRCRKLKGHSLDVKNGCGPSVGPSLNPPSLG